MRLSGDAENKHARDVTSRNLTANVAKAAAGLLAVGLGLALGLDQKFVRSDVLARGVHVAGLQVGGLSAEEARTTVEGGVHPPSVVSFAAADLEKTLNLPASSVGLEFDLERTMNEASAIGRKGFILKRVAERHQASTRGINVPLRADYNTGALKWVLMNTARDRFGREPVNASIDYSGGLVKKAGQNGTAVDLDKSLAAATAFTLEKPLERVQLPVYLKVQEPEITLADLEPIDSVLATYTTRYNSYERARTHNLVLAAQELNGVIIKPGKLFSYNNVVGPRLKENGYREAPIFVNGKIEPGTGGGICQVSSTLYNAALLAGMKIKQRSHHSMIVAYTPPGLDATVSYGVLDFKFENPLKNAAYLRTEIGGGKLTTTLYGSSADKKSIRIVRSVGRTVPYGTRTVVNPSLKPGQKKVVEKGLPGYSVSVKRVIESGGKEVVETISNDRYPPHNVLVHVGPTPAPPVPKEDTQVAETTETPST